MRKKILKNNLKFSFQDVLNYKKAKKGNNFNLMAKE